MTNIYIDPYLISDAKQGDVNAIRDVIDFYFLFTVGKTNEERRSVSESIGVWYEKLLSRSDDPNDWFKYSTFLQYEMHDLGKASEWKYKAAQAGCADAMGSLGADYYSGIPGVISSNPDKARYWWDKEAETKAAEEAAKRSIDNRQQITDYEAYRYFDMANEGFSYAIDRINKATGYNYSALNSTSRLIVECNALEAAAVDNRDVDAKFRLYRLLWNRGRYYPDYPGNALDEGLSWLMKSVSDGHITAMDHLVPMLRNGVDNLMTPDDSQADFWEEQSRTRKEFCRNVALKVGIDCLSAANQGDTECRRKIAMLFGKPYSRLLENERMRMVYYARLQEAENGNEEARYYAGKACMTLFEEQKGLELMEKAAYNGVKDAATDLRRYYTDGVSGVLEPNADRAAEFSSLEAELSPPQPTFSYSEPITYSSSTHENQSTQQISSPSKKEKFGFIKSLFNK